MSTEAKQTAAAAGDHASHVEKLEGEALKAAIKKQVEYYFSKQNLSSDTYLLSLMDSDFFVPVNVIANFGKLKALTTELSLIVDVMKESDQMVLDESNTKVRPKLQQKRSTLILRDIPKETPVEEVQALFKGSKIPDNVRPDVLNTWFVSFDTEDETMAALDFLRAGVKFQGKPVRCAVKSESVIKSVYYADTRAQQMSQMYVDPSSYGMVPQRQWVKNGGGDGRRRPGNVNNSGNNNSGNSNTGRRSGDRSARNGSHEYAGNHGGHNNNNNNANAVVNAGSGNNGTVGGATGGQQPQQQQSGANRSNNNNTASTTNSNANNANNTNNTNSAQNANAAKGKAGRRPRKENTTTGGNPEVVNKPVATQPTQVMLSPAHFPPLPSKGVEKMGYSKDFKKYTKEQILEIIRSVEPAKLESIDNHCVVVLPGADVKLEADRTEDERNRRVSMDFDLSHLAKQAVAAVSSSSQQHHHDDNKKDHHHQQQHNNNNNNKDHHKGDNNKDAQAAPQPSSSSTHHHPPAHPNKDKDQQQHNKDKDQQQHNKDKDPQPSSSSSSSSSSSNKDKEAKEASGPSKVSYAAMASKHSATKA